MTQQSSCVLWAFLEVDGSCITACLLTLPTMLISFRVFKHDSTLHGHLAFTVQSFAQDNLLGGGTSTYGIHFCKIKISPSFCHCHFDLFSHPYYLAFTKLSKALRLKQVHIPPLQNKFMLPYLQAQMCNSSWLLKANNLRDLGAVSVPICNHRSFLRWGLVLKKKSRC